MGAVSDAHESLRTPAGIVLCSALVASVFQIYTFPVGGFYVPLSLLLALLSVLYVRPASVDRRVMWLTLLYICSMVISVAWSPSLSAWVNGVVYQNLFFIGLFSFSSIRGYEAKRQAFRFFLYGAATNAVVTVVFRIIPAVKIAYLSNPIRSLFINPNTVESVVGNHINVTDVAKSGGYLFFNGNTNAALNMMCLGISICLIQGRGKPSALFFCAIFLAAIIASGSKSALLVSGAVIVIAMILYYLRTSRHLAVFTVGSIILSIVLVLFVFGVFDAVLQGKFSQETAHTSGYRIGLLQVAVILFKENPILGVGFGGWQKRLASYADFYGLSPEWPPHNSIVLAWSQSGILSVAVLIALFVYILISLVQSYQRTSGSYRPGGAIIAFMCVTAMSLGDAFALFGNSSMAFPLGCVVAYGLKARSKVRPSVERRESGSLRQRSKTGGSDGALEAASKR